MTDRRLQIDYYHVDAFSERVFAGNPAAVVVLERWLADATLAAIAAEHNLSETAFVVPGEAVHELRWFTPTCEVALCGHATLAAAHALIHCHGGFAAPLRFATRRSGEVGVDLADGMLWLDFPVQAIEARDVPPRLREALAAAPVEWWAGVNHLAVFADAATVAGLTPDMAVLAEQSRADDRLVIATAPADDAAYDFVSRVFAPYYGIDEDPVTGSAHCMLAPYWAQRLGRDEVVGHQISARGGRVACRMAGERVHLGGHAVRYGQGRLFIPDEFAHP